MRSITRFAQLLETLPPGIIEQISAAYDADRYDKSFSTREHLISLIYAQVAGTQSLRELEVAFNVHGSRHYHLRMTPLSRSTLSDANQRRNPLVFKEVVEYLMAQVSRQERRELREHLYLLDSSPIQLKGLGFDWAASAATHHHQGIKLHLMIEGTQSVPVYMDLTMANQNDITNAWNIEPLPGATYVFDKGYTDYRFWFLFMELGARFVTRFKTNASLEVLEIRPLDPGEPAVLKDEVVAFKHKNNRGKHMNPYYGTPLRRVTVARPDGGTPLTLATNDLDSSAAEIADLYRSRWKIELFFKWIKQNLKLKRFLGRNKNAVLLQLYAAIITYLMCWLMARKSGQNPSTGLYLWLIRLRQTLMTSVDTLLQREYRQRRRERHAAVTERQHAWAI